MKKVQAQTRFFTATALLPESLEDKEYIGKTVKFNRMGEKRLSKAKLVEIVPIEEIASEDYAKTLRERGHEYGFVVETLNKKNEVIFRETAFHIYEA